ncbi:hypothetical protein [Streptomyces sp. KL116D]|uniref:hypothetical protein n=1 Tax=Streptomyces sp. KL116D TaxID=3045152 RepID=UPI0035565202
MLFTVAPKATKDTDNTAPGTIAVSVNYTDFAGAYGGSYASRMHLVSLPACAVTTPDKKACRTQTALASTNNTADSTLTATTVALSATTPPCWPRWQTPPATRATSGDPAVPVGDLVHQPQHR